MTHTTKTTRTNASTKPANATPAAPAACASRPGDPLPRLLSLADAAAILGCSLKTLRRRIEEGQLPVIRDGRLVRIHPQDLTRYVAVRRSQ